jgi:hypothetical protein
MKTIDRDRVPTTMTAPLERFLAILGAIISLIITILFWLSLSTHQNMWPLPSLYFVEMVALSSISAFVFVRGDSRDNFITWGAAGAISAFSILGALSVGLFYLPVALIFAVISVTSDLRNKQQITTHFGVFLIAGIAQSVLMFAAIRLLDSSAVF